MNIAGSDQRSGDAWASLKVDDSVSLLKLLKFVFIVRYLFILHVYINEPTGILT